MKQNSSSKPSGNSIPDLQPVPETDQALSPADPSTWLARLLGGLLAGAGFLALLAAGAQFILGLLLPAMLILVLGIFLAKGALHRATGSNKPFAKEAFKFSAQTGQEALRFSQDFIRSATNAFGEKKKTPASSKPSK